MEYELKVPAAGDSITSATVGKWNFADGDSVSAGDVVVIIETDKVSHELEAESDGVLKILIPEGEDVEIGAKIGFITAKKTSDEPTKPKQSEQKAEPKESKEEKEATKKNTENEIAKAKSENTEIAEKKLENATAEKQEKNLDKTSHQEASEITQPRNSESSGKNGDKRIERKKMSTLRRKIAEHLVNAQNQAAILTTFNECDMSEVMEIRRKNQKEFTEIHGIKLGFMSFFIKAVVHALKEVPQLNTQIDGGDADYLIQNYFYDISVAIGSDKGLFVPVIRDCEQKSFAEIELDLVNFAQKARDGKITFEDLSGGVFTISNGGVYGSLLSTPILNPPQCGILGMHSIQKRPVVIEDEIEIRPMMNLALSYDHRIVDGKVAVTFLVSVKKFIENPVLMLVGNKI